ncbi:hypothetical protein MHLP_00365 [Candidatus Mycoplasma haematolamae str. Purdue]|uniref:Uncharacterized protein n=1 Tax=Mycoplasma haematolamae (strain Purdue) TaxID=1212765 RepID=I7BIK6_MYCHA|nr:hypothetical protein MHLP_00365 [Candidatus Mycoplasma haematolamae str. Purdue]
MPLKAVTLVLAGGGALGTASWGIYEIVDYTTNPKYQVGMRYGVPETPQVSLDFGPVGDFETLGVWFTENASSIALSGHEWQENSSINSDIKKILDHHPGLGSFLDSKIEEYKRKRCDYQQTIVQKIGGVGRH